MRGIVDSATGVYLIDKPAGITSFEVVRRVRRALRMKKVGHAGTLDPFATGLLVVCAGRPATRETNRLMAADKLYLAELALGRETDTGDPEGRVTAERSSFVLPDAAGIEAVLASFTGRVMQRVPAYAAVKHQGRPLYHYARKGVKVEKEPRPVVIHAIDLVAVSEQRLQIRVRCGKGTYIRVLAEDIGRELGCLAHLAALRRLAVGPFTVDEAVSGAELAEPEPARSLLLPARIAVEEALARVGAVP